MAGYRCSLAGNWADRTMVTIWPLILAGGMGGIFVLRQARLDLVKGNAILVVPAQCYGIGLELTLCHSVPQALH